MNQDQGANTFGQFAVRIKLLTEERLAEALFIQKKMRDMGVEEILEHILVKKGYLTEPQVSIVQRAMGVHTAPIPGITILSKLGQGGMGAVYKARQESVNRIVAVKILSSLLTQDKNFVDRFFAEARVAAGLSHSNIIAVYDCAEANGTFYLIMEYADGCTLRELLQQKGQLEERKSARYMVQVCDALQYLHEQSMVHRDIKPDNLMLTTDGSIKLCDFGLAKSLSVDQGLTMTGFVVGTPYYMSPEQIEGRQIDIRSDLYSVGATLFHLLTGVVPFAAPTAPATMQKHLTEKIADPRKYNPKLSRGMVAVIMRLMDKDPARRYQTPKELAEDLRRLVNTQIPLHAAARPPTRRVMQKRQRSLALPIALGSAFVVAVLTVALSMDRPRPVAPHPTPVAKRENPQPEPVRQPPPIVLEAVSRVDEAKRLLKQADEQFDKQRWPSARESYEQLLTRYGDLVQNTVLERIRRCEVAQRDAATFESGEALARSHEQSERFEEAVATYQKLLDPTLSKPDGGMARIQEAIARCQVDQAAKLEFARLQDLFAKESWKAFIDALASFRQAHGKTRFAIGHASSLDQNQNRALVEYEAVRRIEELKSDTLEPTMEKLDADLRAFYQRCADTGACRKNKSLLEEYERRVNEARGRKVEQEASQKFLEAEALFNGRRWQEAIEAYKGLAKFGDTKLYKDKEAQTVKRISACAEGLRADRDREAEDRIKKARSAHQAQNWDEIAVLLKELEDRYADSRPVKNNAPLLANIKKDLTLNTWEVVKKFDFESTLGAWKMEGQYGLPTVEHSPIAREGSKSAKIVFLGKGGTGHAAFLNCGAIPGTQRVSLFARAPAMKKGDKLSIRVFLREAKATWQATIPVTSEWTDVSLLYTTFKVYRSQESGEGRQLEAEKIESIGFEPADTSVPLELQVDTIRFEKRP